VFYYGLLANIMGFQADPESMKSKYLDWKRNAIVDL